MRFPDLASGRGGGALVLCDPASLAAPADAHRVPRDHHHQDTIRERPSILPKDMPLDFDSVEDYDRYQREQDALSQHMVDMAAAISIQAVARGWLVRRRVQELYGLMALSVQDQGQSVTGKWRRPPPNASTAQLVAFGSAELQVGRVPCVCIASRPAEGAWLTPSRSCSLPPLPPHTHALHH